MNGYEEANLFSAGPAAVSWTVNGLEPNTTYYVRVRANGSGEYGNSAYSASKSIATTGVGGGGDGGGGGGGNGNENGENGGSGDTDFVVGELQNWLESLKTEFQNVAQLVPQLVKIDLNSTERRRLLGSGVRRYGFIEKVFVVSGDYPQFWPGFGDGREELSGYLQEIDVLRNLLIWFRSASRVVQDLLLIAGNEAFRVAGTYYAFAHTSARQRNPEAAQVYAMLRLFWKRRRRMSTDPTFREIERDLRALNRGTKEGKIVVANEGNRFIKGKKVLLDETFPVKQHASAKVVEEEEGMWE